MKKKKVVLAMAAAIILLSLLFREHFIQIYVSVFHGSLGKYSVSLLEKDKKTTGRYGLWKVTSYPEEGMVEFMTGGSGLAPASAYKGFYYSADDTHKIFSAANQDAVTMETAGDHALWSDGTDNHGSSDRIAAKWFWFEASF